MSAYSEARSCRSEVERHEHQQPEVLQTFHLYVTKSRLYLVGCGASRSEWRILKFARSLELDITEDPTTYTEAECAKLLKEIHDGNRNVGGLKLLCTSHGVAGLVRFLDGYYLLLITQRRYLGRICNHPVYGMDEVKLQPLLHPDAGSNLSGKEKAHEQRYQRLLMQVLEKKDEFFFSYSYNLHLTLQANLTQTTWSNDAQRDPFSSMFVWNQYLTKELRNLLGNSQWVLPLVHGFWQQRSLSLFGRIIRVTLIARRSRHFAGTRYRKRGVNKQGYVANDVETEQVVDASEDWTGATQKLASVVQVRGSIPLFWSQEEATLTAPKPDIHLQHFDPLFNATRLHFKDLAFRYGCPITVLNLVKEIEKSPRESLLGEEFHDAIRYLNRHLPEDENIRYIPFDFQKMKRTSSHDVVIGCICRVVRDATQESGIFCYQFAPGSGKRQHRVRGEEDKEEVQEQVTGSSSAAAIPDAANDSLIEDDTVISTTTDEAASEMGSVIWEGDLTTMELGDHLLQPYPPHLGPSGDGQLKLTYQVGVLRTNCIDCLDRTNVAQFALGLVALGQQFQALGVTEHADIDVESTMSVELGHMYEAMGNCLAQQYGGSDAHTKFFKDQRGQWSARTQGEDVMTSLRRFYSNINTDPEKQDAMNLFLGRFVPQLGKPPVWELGNDAHLHASRGLLLDEDNFDIFWGETLGQPLISPMDTARDAPVPPSSSAIALHGHDHELHHPNGHWGTGTYCILGMRSMPSWSSTICSGTDRSSLTNHNAAASALSRHTFPERPYHSVSDLSRVAGIEQSMSSACSESSWDLDMRSLGRGSMAGSFSFAPAPPFSAQRDNQGGGGWAAGNFADPPGLLFLDEILSQEPNRVTEVRLYAPPNQGAGEHEHDEEGQAAGTSVLDLFTGGSIDTPGRTDRGYYSDSGVRSPHPIYKHVLNLRPTAESRRITSEFDVLLGSPRTEPGDGVAPLQIRCSLASEQQGPVHRRPGPSSPEMGWPVHPLMDLPVVVDAEGTREGIEGQIGQTALLWDTIVMDWVHGRSSGAEEPQQQTGQQRLQGDFGGGCCLGLLQKFPEDADLAESFVSPAEADKVFSEYTSRPAMADLLAAEATALLDDITRITLPSPAAHYFSSATSSSSQTPASALT